MSVRSVGRCADRGSERTISETFLVYRVNSRCKPADIFEMFLHKCRSTNHTFKEITDDYSMILWLELSDPFDGIAHKSVVRPIVVSLGGLGLRSRCCKIMGLVNPDCVGRGMRYRCCNIILSIFK